MNEQEMAQMLAQIDSLHMQIMCAMAHDEDVDIIEFHHRWMQFEHERELVIQLMKDILNDPESE